MQIRIFYLLSPTKTTLTIKVGISNAKESESIFASVYQYGGNKNVGTKRIET